MAEICPNCPLSNPQSDLIWGPGFTDKQLASAYGLNKSYVIIRDHENVQNENGRWKREDRYLVTICVRGEREPIHLPLAKSLEEAKSRAQNFEHTLSSNSPTPQEKEK